MDLNTLPWNIKSNCCSRNFFAGRMFKEVLGRKIIDASVTASLNEPTFTGSFGLHLEEQPSYVQSFAFVCVANDRAPRSPTWVDLSFKSWFDYGHVSLKAESELLHLPGPYLKEVTEGYLSPDILESYLS